MVYKSKALVSARGRINITFAMYLKKHSRPFIETGSSQSVNIARNINITINDALLNAFYKLQHRRGFPIHVKNSSDYNEMIDKFLQDFQVIKYDVEYFETQARSYKQVRRAVTITTAKGEEKIVTKAFLQSKKDDKIVLEEPRKSLTIGELEDFKDNIFDAREEASKRQRILK